MGRVVLLGKESADRLRHKEAKYVRGENGGEGVKAFGTFLQGFRKLSLYSQ